MFGFLESSFVDYPGKICSVIFSSGCKLRCPFCHNPQLVLEQEPCSASQEDILKHLEKRRNVLDAVCISGGEPLLKLEEWIDLLSPIKELGLLVKLDTNGLLPEQLQYLLQLKIIDYIAMDIKTSTDKYPQASGVPDLDISPFQKSVKLIQDSGLDYEFRTTVVPDFYTEEDAVKIGEWLKGSKRYVLQQFSNRQEMIDPAFENVTPYPPSKLEEFRKILEPYFGEVLVKGA